MHTLIQNYEFDIDADYEDPMKSIKNTLTDFVDEEFLNKNLYIIRLLALVYQQMNPLLDKYGLKLIFKGGNVMRLVNKNIQEYLAPDIKQLIENTFGDYLKQSDNDFTIFVNPNINNYELLLTQITYEVFHKLDKVKKRIMDNLPHYFDIFNDNKSVVRGKFMKLKRELGVKSVKLYPTQDKEIVFTNNKKNISVFNNDMSTWGFVFNSLNTTLEFRGGPNDIVKFNLLRSKVNFILNTKVEAAGELIDISIPHKRDQSMRKFTSTPIFNKYMKNNVITVKTSYGFSYHMINVNYIVHDLMRILFVQFEYPWLASKYEKRLARLLYFIFIDELNKLKMLSLSNTGKLANMFKNFLFQIAHGCPNYLKNKSKSLQKICYYSQDLPKNSEHTQYVNFIKKYVRSIQVILRRMQQYFAGRSGIQDTTLYKLNVV